MFRAIRRLKNGRAAGADGITAELLKGAEKPISEALHKVITNVRSTGRVPVTVKHILIECVDLNDVRNKHFVAPSIKDLFDNSYYELTM